MRAKINLRKDCEILSKIKGKREWQIAFQVDKGGWLWIFIQIQEFNGQNRQNSWEKDPGIFKFSLVTPIYRVHDPNPFVADRTEKSNSRNFSPLKPTGRE